MTGARLVAIGAAFALLGAALVVLHLLPEAVVKVQTAQLVHEIGMVRR